MDFDPLSLYTPQAGTNISQEVPDVTQLDSNYLKMDTSQVEVLYDEDNDLMMPIHPLDLPSIQYQPPPEVLLTFLRLLSPAEVYNFSNSVTSYQEYSGVRQTFEQKNINIAEVEKAILWLSKYCSRFDTLEKLLYVPSLSGPLKATAEYNAWLGRIISSGLFWIVNHDDILKEATLRLSENCGRTAQPEIIRKIGIPNLDKVHSSSYLQLREPSLTGDNLGLKTWGSSLILAHRLVNSPSGKYLKEPVLELGSGTGLVGMVSAILGYKTYLTDLKEIVPNLISNIEVNKIDCVIHELDWRNPKSFQDKFPSTKFKTIILSDPIYSSLHPQWVFNMVNEFLDPDADSRVLLQIPLRPKFENERGTLWSFMNSFEEKEDITEDGYDDFGAMKYNFKLYMYK